jgi:hypothetical protein
MDPRKARRRPSPALVISLIALFASLGGTSYAVATGSVDSREIKNNTVRSKDIRNNDIRGKDVRNGTLTGSDINEPSLGEVPRASSAASADNAGAVNGIRIAKVAFNAPAGTAARPILSAGGLVLRAACDASAHLNVTARTTAAAARIFAFGIADGGGPHALADPDFRTTHTFDVDEAIGDDTANPEAGVVEYFDAATDSHVSVDLSEDIEGSTSCYVYGTALID